MTVAGALLLVGVQHFRGAGSLAGVGRACGVAVLAAALAIVGGRIGTNAVVAPGVSRSLAAGLVGAVVTIVLLAVVVVAADRSDARALLSRIGRSAS
jgi:putative peptidoglycan lipid II flippase